MPPLPMRRSAGDHAGKVTDYLTSNASSLIKYALLTIAVLYLLFGVVRPIVKDLVKPQDAARKARMASRLPMPVAACWPWRMTKRAVPPVPLLAAGKGLSMPMARRKIRKMPGCEYNLNLKPRASW
jgi:hypothetical protein